jgi:polyhydroxyalkanoate synthesis regulator phasin
METTKEISQTDWDYQLGMKIERMIQRHEQIADLKTEIQKLTVQLERLENNE